MHIIIPALLIVFSIFTASCTETVTNTVIERDTVTITIHDTVSIPNIIDDTLTTVILLRHAEKDSQGADPILNADGQLRAQELTRILSNVTVSNIYTTPFNRTRQTITQLAESKGLTAIEYDANISAAQLANKVKAENKGKTAVVVGHSNTIPELLKSFSNNSFVVQIAESQYDNLFIASLHADKPKIVHLKYGKVTP
ncbi:MAG: phosphoglycerate mutase family protein [Bacteroidota bacterium]